MTQFSKKCQKISKWLYWLAIFLFGVSILFKETATLLWGAVFSLGAALTMGIVNYFLQKETENLQAVWHIVDDLIESRYHRRYRGKFDKDTDALGGKVNQLAEKLERKTKQIHEHHAQLDALVKHLTLGVMVLNRRKQIVLYNPALTYFLGDRVDDLVGQPYKIDLVRSSGLLQLIDRAYQEELPQKGQVYFYDPLELVVEATVIPIFSEEGQLQEVLVLLYDLTEMKRVQTMKSDFLANASHELKTPVSVIRGFAETLMDGAKDDPVTRDEFLGIIYQESRKLEQLMQDILALSKLEQKARALEYEPVMIKESLDKSLQMVEEAAQARHIQLIMEEVDPKISFIGDQQHFIQIISNLLMNAIRYTREGGYVRVRVKEENQKLLISVKDNGIGIAPKDQTRIFERFYRGEVAQKFSAEGTGLGLAIVKNLVESMKAEIEVDSQVGFGTTMTLIIKK